MPLGWWTFFWTRPYHSGESGLAPIARTLTIKKVNVEATTQTFDFTQMQNSLLMRTPGTLGLVWSDLWDVPWIRAVLGLVILCILIAIAFYVLSSFRAYTEHDHPKTHFAPSNLEEMLRRGDISEAEFRIIKSKSHCAGLAEREPSPRSVDPTSTETHSSSSEVP